MKKISIFVILALFSLVLLTPKSAHALDWTGQACNTVADCTNQTQFICAFGPNPAGGAGYRQCAQLNTVAGSAAAAGSATKQFVVDGPNNPNLGLGGLLLVQTPIALITNTQHGGGVQALGAMTALYNTKPASTYIAFMDFKKNMGFPVKDTYAQGFGFTSLNPILGLWKIIRDIALAGFVIIFIVVGIMLMLRKKIDPRTVITIQQALPKLIVSLVLVIFSYAICGFLIDVMQISTSFGLRLFQRASVVAMGDDPEITMQALLRANFFELMYGLGDSTEIVKVLETFGSTQIGSSGFAFLSSIFDAPGAGGIYALVIHVAMFVAILKAAFMLVTAYIGVIFNILISPIKFLLMAIPGSQATFGAWIRDMAKHLLVFPVVFFMLMFAAILGSSQGTALWVGNGGQQNLWQISADPNGPSQNGIFDPTNNNSFWYPPALGNWSQGIGQIMMLGIILTIPKASSMISEALQLRPGSSEGAAGEEMKRAAGRIPVVGSLLGR